MKDLLEELKSILRENVHVDSDEEWETTTVPQSLKDSKYFIVMIHCDCYFSDERVLKNEIYARLNKKPFRIFVKKGVEIPDGYLNYIEDYKIFRWEDREDLTKQSKEAYRKDVYDDTGVEPRSSDYDVLDKAIESFWQTVENHHP